MSRSHDRRVIPGKPEFNKTAAVITISDRGSRGEREDASGRALKDRLQEAGYEVVFQITIPDNQDDISAVLRECADKRRLALVVTTGGTGVGPRDVTPEATLAIVERTVPGMAEAMRARSLLSTFHAMISRAVVGIRGTTLIINLPGSPKGALENIEVVIPALNHTLEKIQGDPSECAGSGDRNVGA